MMSNDLNLQALYESAMSQPDAMATAQLAAAAGMTVPPPTQLIQNSIISTSIYDANPNPDLEANANKLMPEKTYRAVAFKALGCGVSPMTYIRQQIAYGLTTAKFDLDGYFTDDKGARFVPADNKRNKDEDSKTPPTLNKVLQAFLREPSYSQLNYLAKGLGVSTQAAMVACLNILSDVEETNRLLDDSDEAMKLHRQAKKKMTVLNEFITQV